MYNFRQDRHNALHKSTDRTNWKKSTQFYIGLEFMNGKDLLKDVESSPSSR